MILGRANIATLLTSLSIQGCGIITGVLTARILGPTARGELATVMLWPMILSNLGLMGCNWAVAREIAADPQRESDWVQVAAISGLALACSYLAIGYFLVPYLLPSDKQHLIGLTRVCLLLIPLDIFNQILLATEQGRMRWRRYNLLRASFFAFYAVLICGVWLSRLAEVRWFVWAFLGSHLLAVGIRLAIQWKALMSSRLHVAGCWRLLRSGIPFFWSTVSNLLTLQLDKVLVVALMPTKAVGLYAAAVTFGNAHSALGEALGITSFAVLANESSTEKQGRILSATFRQATLTALGLGTVLACLIPFLVRPMFGTEFSRAVVPAVILTVAASLNTAGNILNQGLKGVGQPYAGVVSQFLGNGILAILALVLSPRLGLMGIAWAVVASVCCQVLLLVVAASAILGISSICFWPLHPKDLRVFYQQLAALRAKAFAFSGPGACE
jgi:O-antigen/teichoic acid export membrane protein